MATSMASSLPRSHALTSFTQSGRASAPALGPFRVSVARARLGAFENARAGQCSSGWAGGELRRRVFEQRRSVTLRNLGRRELKIVAEEEKADVFKGALLFSTLYLVCVDLN